MVKQDLPVDQRSMRVSNWDPGLSLFAIHPSHMALNWRQLVVRVSKEAPGTFTESGQLVRTT